MFPCVDTNLNSAELDGVSPAGGAIVLMLGEFQFSSTVFHLCYLSCVAAHKDMKHDNGITMSSTR